MDLKIKDVTELLSVSEEAVRRWLAEGSIPSYKIEGEARFSRTEIEDWLMQHKLGPEFEEELVQQGNRQFNLYRALYRGDVLIDVPGESKEDIFRQAMQHMAELHSLDAEVLTDLFLDRERMMSTALGSGIAVPHTRDFLLDTHFDVVLTVYPKVPLPFDALDGEPVHTLFFLFACEDTHHLNLLSKVAHLNVNEKARAFLGTKPSKERLLEYVKQWESSLH